MGIALLHRDNRDELPAIASARLKENVGHMKLYGSFGNA
jgi:hypothetical protein